MPNPDEEQDGNIAMQEETKLPEGLDGVKSEMGITENPEEETAPDTQPDDEFESQETEKGDGDTPKTADELEDLKRKNAESFKESMRLKRDKEIAEAELEEERAKSRELQETLQSKLSELEETDPTSAELMRVKNKLKELERSNLLEKEARTISEFVEQNPQAKDDREALKALMRANPKKSPEDLWEIHLKPAYDRGVSIASETLRKKVSSKPETGKGSKTGEPTEGVPDGFNSWALDKRKAWFKKHGVSGTL